MGHKEASLQNLDGEGEREREADDREERERDIGEERENSFVRRRAFTESLSGEGLGGYIRSSPFIICDR